MLTSITCSADAVLGGVVVEQEASHGRVPLLLTEVARLRDGPPLRPGQAPLHPGQEHILRAARLEGVVDMAPATRRSRKYSRRSSAICADWRHQMTGPKDSSSKE